MASSAWQHQLVQPQRAEHGIAADARDEVGVARDDPGLRAAQQFVAAERDQVDPGGAGCLRQRFVQAR